jgi:hypothetical protein
MKNITTDDKDFPSVHGFIHFYYYVLLYYYSSSALLLFLEVQNESE